MEQHQVEKLGDHENVEITPENAQGSGYSSSEPGFQEKCNNLEVEQPSEIKLIDQFFEDLTWNWHIISIYLVISLFLLADGGEMIVLSLLIKKLGTIWQLTEFQKGFLGSCVFIGFFVGALSSGKVSDIKGRKPTFVLGSLLVCIFGLGSAFAANYTQLVILRMFFGFGIGLSIPAISSLTTEITKLNWRAWVLNIIWFFFPVGEMLAVIEAKYLMDDENGWRILLGLVGLPCLLCFFLSFAIYESPRYYLSTRQYEKAFNNLNRYLESSKLSLLSELQKTQLKEENEKEINKNQHKSDYSQLFSKDYLRLTLLNCQIFFICSFVYYGLLFIQPQISDDSASKADSDSKMFLGLILSSFSELPSTLLASYLANLKFLGRMKSLAVGFIMSMISASLCFYIPNNKFIFMTMLKFSISIPFGVIYIYVCESFPTKFRTIGIGVCNSFNRLGGISTPLISQLSFSYNKNIPFFNFAVLCFFGIIASLSLPFETLGKQIL